MQKGANLADDHLKGDEKCAYFRYQRRRYSENEPSKVRRGSQRLLLGDPTLSGGGVGVLRIRHIFHCLLLVETRQLSDGQFANLARVIAGAKACERQ